MTNSRKVRLHDNRGQADDLLSSVNRKFGMVPNAYATMANSPSTLLAVLTYSEALDQGSLSSQLKEKIALAVSNENSCRHCVSADTAIACSLNMTDDEIVQAQRGRSADDREQLVLDLAISLNSNHGHGDNSAIRAALAAGVTVEEIIEILGQVMKTIMINTMSGIGETEIDFPEIALN